MGVCAPSLSGGVLVYLRKKKGGLSRCASPQGCNEEREKKAGLIKKVLPTHGRGGITCTCSTEDTAGYGPRPRTVEYPRKEKRRSRGGKQNKKNALENGGYKDFSRGKTDRCGPGTGMTLNWRERGVPGAKRRG